MKKLLLSGLGGSLFPYLHDQLKEKYLLYYVDSDELLTKLYPDYNFFVAPLVTDISYGNFIENLIEKYKIDFYIPLIDEELIKAKTELDGYNGVKVLAPTSEFCNLCLNKFDLMKALAKLEISNIESHIGSDFQWEGNDSIFVKPISGRGSRGIKKIHSSYELEAYYILEKYKPEEILIQEFVGGVEYTIGATVNDFNEILSISIKRIIRKKGITQVATIEENKTLLSVVRKVVDSLKPCGPINIQLYLTAKGEAKIFEINPRFSTTTIMSYAGGIDEIDLYIQYSNKHFNREPLQPKFGLTLHRRWESVFYEA